MIVKFLPNDTVKSVGCVAAAELHFTEGPLAGLKLIGFSVWQRRSGSPNEFNVTFPARQYAINGERRSFSLLRPIADKAGQERIRALILDAYAAYARVERSADRDAFTWAPDTAQPRS